MIWIWHTFFGVVKQSMVKIFARHQWTILLGLVPRLSFGKQVWVAQLFKIKVMQNWYWFLALTQGATVIVSAMFTEGLSKVEIVSFAAELNISKQLFSSSSELKGIDSWINSIGLWMSLSKRFERRMPSTFSIFKSYLECYLNLF